MTTETHPGFVVRHPWLFVVGAFMLLLAAWTTLIFVAVKSGPAQIELKP